MAGQVRAAGQVVPKPSTKIDPAVSLTVDHGPPFVSRGGEKLAAAFEAFDLSVDGCVCADVGASTGGFTDCMLQHGAARVYAIDVGRGILHWKLRKDTRVVVLEGTNARYLEQLPEPVDFITIDASFISLKLLLPVVKHWFAQTLSTGDVLALIKPQFEAGRKEVARGKGVIRDPEIHHRVLMDVLSDSNLQGYAVKGLLRSPVPGPKGNIEFLAWLDNGQDEGLQDPKLEDMVVQVVTGP
jgi:23S rRNA (cytidine1920-2'-O)/16S rRNA (cytidine1409-2'-O)-methyltransferase